MNRLAILILKSHDTAEFEDTLASVLANRPDSCQVLVVCPGGYQDPYELGGEVDFIEAAAEAQAAELVNVGLEQIDDQCEVVHILVSGMEVAEGWTEPALRHFADPQIGSVAPLVVRPDGRIEVAGIGIGLGGEPFLVAAGRRHGRRLPRRAPLGPSLHAAFYRRQPLLELRGCDRRYPSWLANADLAMVLSSLGFRTVLESDSRVTGELDAMLTPTAFRLAQFKERFFWKHNRSGLRLFLHPLLVLLETMGNLVRGGMIAGLSGRALGLLQVPFEGRGGSTAKLGCHGAFPQVSVSEAQHSHDPPRAGSYAEKRPAA